MLTAKETASELVSLLTLCQTLLSEKDGVVREAPDVYSRDRDAFSERIVEACMHAKMLEHLLPMYSQLAAVGEEMERQGKIRVNVGQSYARVALDHLQAQYLPGLATEKD